MNADGLQGDPSATDHDAFLGLPLDEERSPNVHRIAILPKLLDLRREARTGTSSPSSSKAASRRYSVAKKRRGWVPMSSGSKAKGAAGQERTDPGEQVVEARALLGGDDRAHPWRGWFFARR